MKSPLAPPSLRMLFLAPPSLRMPSLAPPSLRMRVLGLVASAALCSVGCEGRDPLVTLRNQEAVIVPPPPPPPPPVPEVRTLGTRRLFGTMPIDNRFQDPLMTFSGTGWFAFANANVYPTVVRQVGASPTQTPFVKMAGADNPSGVTLLGQLKTTTTALHTEVWLGRDGDAAGFESVEVSLAGLFVSGEQIVALQQDEASHTVIEGRTWSRFTADLSEGPVGWAYLMATDTDAAATLYFGGPTAVDLDVGAGAAIVSSSKRALTANEKRLIAMVQEKTRTLAPPASARPTPFPGMFPDVAKAR